MRTAQSCSLLTLAVCSALGLAGCSESDTNQDPRRAASQLEQIFEGSPSEVKNPVEAAAAAMRNGDFEIAVVSLQSIRNRPDITLEQGLAIHHSSVAVEKDLIRAMEAGDEKARRAYQLLKNLKRN